jgi:hypothetical protein
MSSIEAAGVPLRKRIYLRNRTLGHQPSSLSMPLQISCPTGDAGISATIQHEHLDCSSASPRPARKAGIDCLDYYKG